MLYKFIYELKFLYSNVLNDAPLVIIYEDSLYISKYIKL